MTKRKWIILGVLLVVLAAAVGITVRQQREASSVLAEAHVLYQQWGVMPDSDETDAVQQAIDAYNARWNQLCTWAIPYENTPEAWQRDSQSDHNTVSVTLGSWSMDWAPLFLLNRVAKATVRTDSVYVEQAEDGSYRVAACIARDKVRAKMAWKDGAWKVEAEQNDGDEWMLPRYVLSGAQSAAKLLEEWDDKMNAAQKSALQNAAEITQTHYDTLDEAVAAAREIDVDAFCPLHP